MSIEVPKMKGILLWSLLTAILVAPGGTAQVPASDFELQLNFEAGYIDPSGPTSIPFEITIGCALILQGAEQSAVSVSGTGPSWLSVAPADVDVSLADCAGDDDLIILKSGTIAITPASNAPGLENFDVAFMASFVDAAGSETTSPASLEGLAVDYVAGHTVTPAGDQRFEVTDGTYTFELDIEIQANARTMVMFENRVVSGGTLDGMTHTIFDVPAGNVNKTYTVTWTAPSHDWMEETVTFYTYSHCLDRNGCDPTNEANPVWTYVNANPSKQAEPAAGKGIPAPSFALVLVGLAIALIARRT